MSKLIQKAYRIIAKYGDADMTHDDLKLLLIMNDIPNDVVVKVANDLRPE